jgi:intracellular sulfur oxidation DsrE/DsrF family protein
MKTIVFIIAILCSGFASMQTKPVRIVFDVTSKDTLSHQATIRHVLGMSKAYPDAKFEVVIYGGALPLATKGKTSQEKLVQQLCKNPNVEFKVCEVAMKHFEISENELVPGVVVVPDAIMEIVSKQGQGWAYIKEAHN